MIKMCILNPNLEFGTVQFTWHCYSLLLSDENYFLQSLTLSVFLLVLGRTVIRISEIRYELVVKAEAGKAVPGRVLGRAVPWAEFALDFRPRSG